MKKIFILCLMAFVVCINLKAQERTNGEKLTFDNNRGIQCDSFWRYDDITEQWESYNLPITIAIKSVRHNDTLHHIIQLGHYFALLTEEEYKTIISVDGYYFFNFYSYPSSFFDDENKIIRHTLNCYKTKKPHYLSLAIQSYNDVIRFFFVPTLADKFSIDHVYYEVNRTEWNKFSN